jgi:hypothetical protein
MGPASSHIPTCEFHDLQLGAVARDHCARDPMVQRAYGECAEGYGFETGARPPAYSVPFALIGHGCGCAPPPPPYPFTRTTSSRQAEAEEEKAGMVPSALA